MVEFFNKPVRNKDEIYFSPTRVIAWLIQNTKYDVVRAAGKPNYLDIEPAAANCAVIRSFLEKTIGATEIIESIDASEEEITK